MFYELKLERDIAFASLSVGFLHAVESDEVLDEERIPQKTEIAWQDGGAAWYGKTHLVFVELPRNYL